MWRHCNTNDPSTKELQDQTVLDLLPAFFAVENNLFEDEDDEEAEDDDELGDRVVDLRVISVFNLVEDMVESFVNVWKSFVEAFQKLRHLYQFVHANLRDP